MWIEETRPLLIQVNKSRGTFDRVLRGERLPVLQDLIFEVSLPFVSRVLLMPLL